MEGRVLRVFFIHLAIGTPSAVFGWNECRSNWNERIVSQRIFVSFLLARSYFVYDGYNHSQWNWMFVTDATNRSGLDGLWAWQIVFNVLPSAFDVDLYDAKWLMAYYVAIRTSISLSFWISTRNQPESTRFDWMDYSKEWLQVSCKRIDEFDVCYTFGFGMTPRTPSAIQMNRSIEIFDGIDPIDVPNRDETTTPSFPCESLTKIYK